MLHIKYIIRTDFGVVLFSVYVELVRLYGKMLYIIGTGPTRVNRRHGNNISIILYTVF